MTQKEEIALLKQTIEELKMRVASLEARPFGMYPQPISPPWTPQPTVWPYTVGDPPYWQSQTWCGGKTTGSVSVTTARNGVPA